MAAQTPGGYLFRAVEINTGRKVSLWLSGRSENPTARDSMLDFAQNASGIAHPFINQISHCGQYSERVFVVFSSACEFLLSNHECRTLSSAQAISIVCALAEAVDAVHRANLFVGTIRPENIMLTSDAKWPLLMLVSSNPEAVQDDDNRSPEEKSGCPADFRSDIWAIGKLMEQMFGVMSGVDQGSISIRRILDRCLKEEPRLRYHTAGELAEALKGLGTNAHEQPVTPDQQRYQGFRWGALWERVTRHLFRTNFWSAPPPLPVASSETYPPLFVQDAS